MKKFNAVPVLLAAVLALGSILVINSSRSEGVKLTEGSGESVMLRSQDRRSNWMKVWRTADTQRAVPVSRIDVDLNEGETLQVEAAAQVSVNIRRIVMVGSFLRVTSPSGETTIIRRSMAQNITPAMHHMVVPAGAAFRATDPGPYRMEQFVYAASGTARSTDKIVVDYVDLSLVKW